MGKERLNSEQIKEICKIQHKLLIAKILISKMPMAYTNNNVYQLEKDMKIRDIVDNCENEMKELLLKYGSEIIVNTFSDKEYLQRPENRFTFENQKQATKEVTGEELTLEEFMEKEIIYDKTSEEYKAIKILESKTTNYSDDILILHYNIILYNLIINLMKENKKQQEIIDKAIEYIKKEYDDYEEFVYGKAFKVNLLQILEDTEETDTNVGEV